MAYNNDNASGGMMMVVMGGGSGSDGARPVPSFAVDLRLLLLLSSIMMATVWFGWRRWPAAVGRCRAPCLAACGQMPHGMASVSSVMVTESYGMSGAVMVGDDGGYRCN